MTGHMDMNMEIRVILCETLTIWGFSKRNRVTNWNIEHCITIHNAKVWVQFLTPVFWEEWPHFGNKEQPLTMEWKIENRKLKEYI